MKDIGNILMWCHGTAANNWKDSGWLWRNQFYPCEYSDDPNGEDKVIGRKLLDLGAK